MTIAEMHFDFKEKMNKVDSQQFANYRVPEIDRFLNEGQTLFIKNIAYPRKSATPIVEMTQRIADDLRTIIGNSRLLPASKTSEGYVITLPKDYMFFIDGTAVVTTDSGNKECKMMIRRHRQWVETNPYYGSDIRWREVPASLQGEDITIRTQHVVVAGKINYMRKPKYMHYASGFKPNGTYTIGSNTQLSGTQDCELPEHTHNEIVDMAVFIAKGIYEGYGGSKEKLSVDALA